MKSRLQRIEIRNFKAFREFTLNLEGRHLLVYGPNGSGKSSLYWALHAFLQSARKLPFEVANCFDPSGGESLLNIHVDAATTPGEIALTLRDAATKADTAYRISRTIHETRQQSPILRGALASDFITYRFFFGFSHFRNSEKCDLWPLFEEEILPFCVSTGGKVPLDCWQAIKTRDPNPSGSRGLGGTYAYDEFKRRTEVFASILPGIVDSISDEAQRFYDKHFAKDDPAKFTLKLGVTTKPSFTGTNQQNSCFTMPVIEFGIQVGGKTIARPQTFLNEAKMTQLALSVRFAASLVNLHESDLKLLVLDDLLVSLDMSNRMQVVEILLSDTFANYQKIILTHDLGFFREFRRRLGASHPEWCFLRLEGTANTKIEAKTEKTDLQKAEEYLHGHNLDEAALCLRRAAEGTAKKFLDRDKEVVPTKKFRGLREELEESRNKVLSGLPVALYERVLQETPPSCRALLLPQTDVDLDGEPSLSAEVRETLKAQRKRLRELILPEHVERLRQIRLIDDIIACTERVLNPAAHAGNPPLYEKEVQDALALIKQLESTFAP